MLTMWIGDSKCPRYPIMWIPVKSRQHPNQMVSMWIWKRWQAPDLAFNDEFYFKSNLDENDSSFSRYCRKRLKIHWILEKVRLLDLNKNILLPHYTIPEKFKTQDEYLRHIYLSGNRKDTRNWHRGCWKAWLWTLKTWGFAGYFLIVKNFYQAGRRILVSGRSGTRVQLPDAVAYCIHRYQYWSD